MKKMSSRVSVLLACFLLACLFGCQDDAITSDAPGVEKDMSLTLRVPGTDMAPLSRAMDATDENTLAVGDIYILLFRENEDGKFEYAYRLVTRSFVEDSDPLGATYTIGILHGFPQSDLSASFRAMIVTGLPASEVEKLDNKIAEVNGTADPMKTVRTSLMFSQKANWPLTRKLPMWGESQKSFNLGAQDIVITLLRAVVRVDVGVNFKRRDGNYPLAEMESQGLPVPGNTFELNSVYLFNVPESGRVGPEKLDVGGQVSVPSVEGIQVEPIPPAWRCSYVNKDLVGDINKSLTRSLYVPEADNAIDDNAKAVCLVVGGFFNKEGKETFYRVDLYDRTPRESIMPKPSKDNRISLLRNHVVVVNITGVRARGFESVEDAFNSDPTYLDFDVSAWEQGTDVDITTDGTYFLNAGPSELSYFADGSPQELHVESDYRGELGEGWTMTLDETAKKYVYMLIPGGEIVRWNEPGWPKSGAPGMKNTFRVGMDWYTSVTDEVSTRTAKLAFTAGRMTRTLTLTQTSAENLDINLEPREMNFGKVVQESKELHIGIVATQNYTLQAEWIGENGEPYHWDITSPKGECPDSRFDKDAFFTPVAEKPGTYVIKLADNKTEVVREIEINITAKYDSGESRTVILPLIQSNKDISWKVEGGTGTGNREIIIPAGSSTKTVRIITAPELTWNFSSLIPAEGNDWITNLNTCLNTSFTGSQTIELQLKPNTGVGSRRVMLQASSMVEGFDQLSSQLVITQLGSAPFFDVYNSLAEESPKITKKGEFDWALDFGEANLPSGINASFKVGSNWKWAWEDSSDPDYYKRVLDPNFNPKLAQNTLTNEYSGGDPKEWPNLMTFIPRNIGVWQSYLIHTGPRPTIPDDLPTAGKWSVSMLFTHNYPNMDEEDVKLYSRRLTITRMVPAYTYIEKWSFNDGVHVDQYADQIATDDGTGTGPSNRLGRFIVHTNAPGFLEVLEKSGDSWEVTGVTEVRPKSGYEEFSLRLPAGSPIELKPGIESYQKPLVEFKLRYRCLRKQTLAGDPLQEQEETRTYYSGTEIVEPKRNLLSRQRMVNNGAHDLVFDFSNSKYMILEGKYVVYITDSDGGIVDTERTVDFTLDIRDTKQAGKLKVHLEPNTLVNQYKRVAIFVKRWTAPGVSSWDELKTYVYQDASPLTNGYIVKYTHGPLLEGKSGEDRKFYKYDPKWSRDCSSKGGILKDSIFWYEVSPITKVWKNEEEFEKVVADVQEANAKFLTSGVRIAVNPEGTYRCNCDYSITLHLIDTKKNVVYTHTIGESARLVISQKRVNFWVAPGKVAAPKITPKSEKVIAPNDYYVDVVAYDGYKFVGFGSAYGQYVPSNYFKDSNNQAPPDGTILFPGDGDTARDEVKDVSWEAFEGITARARKPVTDGVNGYNYLVQVDF